MSSQTSPDPQAKTKADLYIDPSRTTAPGTTEAGNPVRWNIGDIPTGAQYRDHRVMANRGGWNPMPHGKNQGLRAAAFAFLLAAAILMILAALLFLSCLVLHAYLNRGEYNPADVVALIIGALALGFAIRCAQLSCVVFIVGVVIWLVDRLRGN
ncbi:hypothetical protein BW14_08345 [Bifidobacterium sp. UTBIF-68]|uniref:hypothetical protein n=1 Tax=Bifidobacterium sp. UTBIF-68 TaxID=1465262 RepID=UPI00112E1D19|nr:hypothetical protein [Bifidobacterium sp. UTBIF-68]TPF92542.1 hypothetical protein BW14_08345 [Bifidobacterium sp. UTBIF-68]